MSRREWGSGLHGGFQLSQVRCPARGQLQAGLAGILVTECIPELSAGLRCVH